jgi:hypothetical protein
MTTFSEKNVYPYLVKANPEQNFLSLRILYLEFKQKYFCASQAHRKQDPPRHFLYLKPKI